MNKNGFRLADGRKARSPRVLSVFSCAFICAILCCGTRVWAQAGREESISLPTADVANDVANDNLDRVGASETQIIDVLNKNPGLMVELKRSVAKDATDHGQIVKDEDLTDSAIFTRLTQDQKFRAVATRLLQRFGYLLPKVNPDSDVGQEQAALLQERIRELVAYNQAQATAAKCSSANHSNDADCPKAQTSGNERSSTPSGTPPRQPDRDINNLLINPAANTILPNEQLVRNGVGSRGSDDSSEASLISNPRVGSDGSLLDASGSGLGGLSSGLGGIGAGSSNAGLSGEANLAMLANSGVQPNLNDSLATPNANSTGFSPGGQPPMSATGASRTTARDGAEADNFEETSQQSSLTAMARHRSPYSDIPSVYDMYASAPPVAGPARRFGEQIFREAPGNNGTLPIDFPASPDYVVGPGDGLSIDLWGGVSQRLVRTVDSEGRVTLPEVGPLEVDGQSLAQVQEAVQRVLRTQFRDVSADVSLSRLRTVRIYVVGDVTHPGPYDVSSLSTPLNALLAADGPTPGGSLRVVEHYRGNVLIQSVDLYDLLLRGVRTDIKRLEPGDTLLVPPMGPQVRIDGMVRRPAIYELHGETNLAQALDLAGGILPTAALGQIEVQRLEAHEKKTMLSLDVSGAANPAEIEAKLAAFEVHDRDEIEIFPIAAFNQDAVYLQGHVVREGRYAYKPGMKLTDLISSYHDLLPEPATSYAEIIRLNAPDYHPSVESFDLAAALANPATAPEIKPQDTVRIFSRFDFENAPVVSVSGAVRSPGTFQTSGEIHVRDAVQLSGGVTQDASMDAAQIIRMMPDSSLKIVSVNLRGALSGDPTYNVLIQPRDRLLIQKNIRRTDPPSVLIGGEVANPGRYALTQNLRVSDLIRIAGGLKRSAQTNQADLTEFVISNDAALAATHLNVDLSAAMTGDVKQDVSLRDGDVLTIREVSGWNDLQASITVQGEVKHPGTYGIRPGERLSSVLARAGGFGPQAYPSGALLERSSVRDLEAKERDAMILRVKDAENGLQLLPENDLQQRVAKETALQQWQGTLEELSNHPPVGRVTMRLNGNIDRWKGTAADIEVQAGDTLVIPKKPGFVLVTGQVFNATAVSYRPGRSVAWYLSQAGGATQTGNKRAVFVIRADGSVLGEQKGLWSGNTLDAALLPGDTVVVPEKALGGTVQWQNLLLSAQVASSIASTLFIALHY